MSHFFFDGDRIAMPEKLMFAEVLHVENILGKDVDDSTSTEQMMAGIYVALRRKYVDKAPTWDELGQMSPVDFNIVADEPTPEPEMIPDPTEDGGQTATSASFLSDLQTRS